MQTEKYYPIESILYERVRNDKIECKIKWQGHSSAKNSWIDKEEIVTIMYLFKKDLTKDSRTDENLRIYRFCQKPGEKGMIQKYMLNSNESQNNDIIFKASLVYSIWVDISKSDFFQIKVKFVGADNDKEKKVKVVDIAEFERFAVKARPKKKGACAGAKGKRKSTAASPKGCGGKKSKK